MKVLITGATGFIGRNITERLNERGYSIVATGRSPTVGNVLLKKGIDFRTGDIRDSSEAYKAFSFADCVIHCAGKIADWGKASEFFDVNVIGTRNIINACKHYGIPKIIFISTPSLYYNGKDRLNIRESEPLPEKQSSVYAKTKLIAEHELQACQKKELDVIILRPRAVYGPHDYSIVPRILKLAERKKFPLIEGGKALTDITFIDNLVDVIEVSLNTAEDGWNRIYNVSNGEPISFRQWFETVLDIFNIPFNPKDVPLGVAKTIAAVMEAASHLPIGPKTPSMTRFSVGYMAKSMTMSIDSLQEHLGYSPQIGNMEGFKRYQQWYITEKEKEI